MQLNDAKDYPVEHSFRSKNIRQWSQSIGLWSCLMLGVVGFAHTKPSNPKFPTAEAAIVGSPFSEHAHASPAAVTVSYSTLNVSELAASAYGDQDF